MRVRQFIMKDSYTFDMDAPGLDVAYQKHYDAYCAIFGRCSLSLPRRASALGCSWAVMSPSEFMVASPAGEDLDVGGLSRLPLRRQS